MPRMQRFLATPLLLTIMLGCVSSGVFGETPTQITLDPSVEYQTMTGWVAAAWIGQDDLPTLFHLWRDEVLDNSVYDLGITRLGISERSGVENPIDYFGEYLNGQIPASEMNQHRYEVINDNADPFSINWDGFQFSRMDFWVDNVVTPFRQRMISKGDTPGVLITMVLFANQGNSDLEYKTNPEEYAEHIEAVFLHLDEKYNWTPDAIEVVLEPDNGYVQWNGGQVGYALVAAADRLATHGYHPEFIVPSTKRMDSSIIWYNNLIQVPNASSYVSYISYHRYNGVSDASLQEIGNIAASHNIYSAMLEHNGSTYEDLHKDLKIGRNSTWRVAGLSDPSGNDYYTVDISNPDEPNIFISNYTKFVRQYFKFVETGAVRIGANTTNTNFDPLAFINSDGNYVVVVKADKGGAFDIQGLPSNTYGIKYTTFSEYDQDLQDVSISQGQTLSTNIPAKGVITIYAKSVTPTPMKYHFFIPMVTLGFN